MKSKIALAVAAAFACVALAPMASAATIDLGFDGSFSISSGLGNFTTPVTLSGTTTTDDAADGSFSIADFNLNSGLGNYSFGTGSVILSGSTLSLYEGAANTFLGTFDLSNIMSNGSSASATGTLTAGNQGLTLPDGNFIGIQGGSGTFSATVVPSAAVPEPATWGMMVLGFGMMGFAMRSRRKQTVKVSYA